MEYKTLIDHLKGKESTSDLKEWKQTIEKELYYQEGLRIIERFMGALFTDQLIILSGPPGTGKTSLPFAVANAIEAECFLVPVQPNWTDNQDLMGYYNPIKNNGNGGYTTTPFLDVLLKAREDNKKVYFIVLDEMNLAHIEYYFSTMLSIMETSDKKIRLYSDSNERDPIIPSEIDFPQNLQIIGTLNMDETTKGISPKVIDRSYVLEIPGNVDLKKIRDKDLKKMFNYGGSPEKGFEDIKKMINENAKTNLSFRLKKQYCKMAERRFLNVDDFVAGKVLPMIRDMKYEKGMDFGEGYPVSNEKLQRMMSLNTGKDKIKYDFWGTN